MVAWHIMEMLKQMNTDEEIEAYSTWLSQNLVQAVNALTAKIAKRIRVTLEDVTMLGYCNDLTMAMSLSMLIPVTIGNEVPHRGNPIASYAFSNISFRFSDREYKFMYLPATKSG